MPFRRPNSPYWQVWVTVPRYGRVGPWSTATTNKKKAEAMEQMLRDLPLEGHGEILKLIPTPYSLPAVYAAKLEGSLEELLRLRADPLLKDAVAEVRPMVPIRTGYGLDKLLELTGPTDRFSILLDHREVKRLLHAREAQGVKRNTVRRGMYRAIRELIKHFASVEDADRVMRQVAFTKENDERKVVLTADQIDRLLAKASATDELFGCMAVVAVTTGIDQGALLAIEPHHFDERAGTLEVHDTKNRFRHRTLRLGTRAQAALRRAIQLTGAGEGEKVWPHTSSWVRYRWNPAREAAGLPHVRFKDLRGVFATNYLRANPGDFRGLQHIMGHGTLEMTMRYVKRLPVGTGEGMDAAEAAMGLSRHLRVEESTG